MGTKNVKITVVGDGTVGKTCMLIAYTQQVFNEKYIPTVFENYVKQMKVDENDYNVALWDTAGQEDYERLRPLSYPNTTCFLICYSISHRASYENVKTKWAPEVRHHMPHTPIIIVGMTNLEYINCLLSYTTYFFYNREKGTKSDLRHVDDPNLILTTEKEGNKMRREVKAEAYFECSAKNMENLDPIFLAAVRSSVKRTKRKKRECVIL